MGRWLLLSIVLGVIVVGQWCIFLIFISRHHHNNNDNETQRRVLPAPIASFQKRTTTAPIVEGVAATLLFRAPQWFHLRYNVMLRNILVNLPNENWKLQVFINEKWFNRTVLPLHPGLNRLLHNTNNHNVKKRIIVTPLPDRLVRKGQRPKDVMVDTWFWESLVADRVMIFSGNGALCGNHNTQAFTYLKHLDYVGAPHRGRPGGAGDFSLRYRPAMLQALRYAKTTQQQIVGSTTEGDFLLKIMQEMNLKKMANFSIATREDTYILGGTAGIFNATPDDIRIPLFVSGTQASLSYPQRDALLKHCPELKVIFPSMHEPACFGAHPQPEACRASICALGETIPPSGC